jgi:hypothetical protein
MSSIAGSLSKFANSLFGSESTEASSTSSSAQKTATPSRPFWSNAQSTPGGVKQVRGAKYPPLGAPSAASLDALGSSAAIPNSAEPSIQPTEINSPVKSTSVSDVSPPHRVSTPPPPPVHTDQTELPNVTEVSAAAAAGTPASHSAFAAASSALTNSFSSLLSSFSKNSPASPSPVNIAEPIAAPSTDNRLARFRRLVHEDDSCDISALRSLSWSGGIPAAVRRDAWQLLLAYAPLNRDRRAPTIERRRAEYAAFVRQYFESDPSSRTETEMGISRQILLDVPRTHSEIPFFRLPVIQKSLERLLYVWSVRHPASGYVQGMNDLATPFMLVFFAQNPVEDPLLSQFTSASLTPNELLDREADCFWCFSKLMDGIQENYVFAQPGIQRAIYRLNELVRRIDAPLVNHLESQGMQFIQFAFRWMNNMLMREFPIQVLYFIIILSCFILVSSLIFSVAQLIVRLWDTYMSEDHEDGFSVFHVYVCAAFILMWAPKIKVQFVSQRAFVSKWC